MHLEFVRPLRSSRAKRPEGLGLDRECLKNGKRGTGARGGGARAFEGGWVGTTREARAKSYKQNVRPLKPSLCSAEKQCVTSGQYDAEPLQTVATENEANKKLERTKLPYGAAECSKYR